MTRPRVNMEVTLGNILQIATMAAAAAFFVIQMDSRGTNTTTAVAAFDGRLTREMAGVQSALDDLRRTVNPIGTLNQRTSEIERRLTEQDARDNAQDQRLGMFAEAIATLRARVEFVSQPAQRRLP